MRGTNKTGDITLTWVITGAPQQAQNPLIQCSIPAPHTLYIIRELCT
jgi:hypothetical protein